MKINFTGDINISGKFEENLKTGDEIFSDNILDVLQESNYTVCNLEGPVTNIKANSKFKVKLNSPKSTITYLTSKNINVYNLANNHIFDSGERGIKDTFTELKQNASYYFGVGDNYKKASNACILEEDGLKIALFGFSDTGRKFAPNNYKIFMFDQISLLKKQIKKIINDVDFVIVNFHGGEEYTNLPSPYKRRFLKKISRIKNVDIVIAHHSHTLQGYEKYKGKYIFYSLGNFIFDIPLHEFYPQTKKSALLNFVFTKSNFSFSFIPYEIKQGFLNDVKYETFKKELETISNFSQYKKKWREEAYNILFKNNKISSFGKETTYYKNSLQNKSFFMLLFSKKFYEKSMKVIKSPNYRSLYISAVLFKLSHKL